MDDQRTNERNFKRFKTGIMKNNFIPYSRQWINNNDIKEIIKVLKTDWITQGPKIKEFEKAVARYCGAKYGVAVSSGTAALHAAYNAAGIQSGDEVITTPLTFVATANMIVHCGGKPVFVDIQEDTLNINPKEIKKKITKKTKVITPVDFAGHPCDYGEILKIARRHNLLVIEDAAQALGSEYKEKKIGSLADMTIFSFHPVKSITTGEGGMIVTSNKSFYEKLKIFRNHGMIKKPEKGRWYYEIENPTYNYRLTDFQCALGISQLKKIDKFIQRRREITSKYNKAFEKIKEIITLTEGRYTKSAYHIYVIQLRLEKLKTNRKRIFEALQKEGIEVQVHHMLVHLQPFYRKRFGYKKGDFPIAERYYERALSLPLFPRMTQRDVKRVISTVNKIIQQYCEK